MKAIFLGVGEACDERFPNTSILVETLDFKKEEKTILFDCGFSSPFEFWKYVDDPNKLDAIWISHFHGDHFMGTPLLLLRLWEMKREKPIVIIGQEGIKSKIELALELAYPGFIKRFAFELLFEEVNENYEYSLLDLKWSFSATEHSTKNLSVALEGPEGKIFYSGDGRHTERTIAIARKSNLLIHEAFHIEPIVPGHGTIMSAIEMASQAEALSLALVHIQRDVRRKHQEEIKKEIAHQGRKFSILLPNPGDQLTF